MRLLPQVVLTGKGKKTHLSLGSQVLSCCNLGADWAKQKLQVISITWDLPCTDGSWELEHCRNWLLQSGDFSFRKYQSKTFSKALAHSLQNQHLGESFLKRGNRTCLQVHHTHKKKTPTPRSNPLQLPPDWKESCYLKRSHPTSPLRKATTKCSPAPVLSVADTTIEHLTRTMDQLGLQEPSGEEAHKSSWAAAWYALSCQKKPVILSVGWGRLNAGKS